MAIMKEKQQNFLFEIEWHIFSYHVPKRPTVQKKIDFQYSKVQFSKRTWTENFQFWALLRQKGLWEPYPKTNVQVFFQILNPVNDAEILAPELVGGQTEMAV